MGRCRPREHLGVGIRPPGRSTHGVVARANAWGLMAFSLRRAVTTNPTQRLHTTHPEISKHGIIDEDTEQDTPTDDALFFGRETAVRDADSLDAIARRFSDRAYTPGPRNKRPLVRGFISIDALAAGMPPAFRQLLYQTTVVPIVDALRQAFPEWALTPLLFPCLPYLFAETATDPRDVPVEIIRPFGSRA